MIINPYIFGVPLLLDTYSAAAAFSFRKLKSTATVSCRVRRSSDNTEQDIGFTGVDLDTTSLSSFVGANSAYITVIYDQSGNGKHRRQTSASAQPRIVNAGTIDTMLGKPAAVLSSTRFMASSTTLAEQISFSTNQRIDSFSVIQQAVGSFVLYRHDLDTSFFNIVGQSGSGSSPFTGTVTIDNHYKNGSVITLTTRGNAYTQLATATPLLYTQINYKNSTQSITKYELSGYSGFVMVGFESEWIIFTTDQSSNRTTIESDINSYYAIY